MNYFSKFPANLFKAMQINYHISNPINIANPGSNVLQRLDDAIDMSLSDNEQLIVSMYFNSGLSYDEICNKCVFKHTKQKLNIYDIREIMNIALGKLSNPHVIEYITGQYYTEYNYHYDPYSNSHPNDKSYPRGLMYAIGINEIFFEGVDYDNMTQDQLDGLEYAISLMSEQDQKLIDMRFKQHMSYKDIAKELDNGRSAIWVSDKIKDACYALRNDEFRIFIVDGKKRAFDQLTKNNNMEIENEITFKSIRNIFSGRVYSFLYYNGVATIGQAVEYMSKPKWWDDFAYGDHHYSLNKLGPNNGMNAMKKLEELGLIDRSNPGWEGIEYWLNEKQITKLNNELDRILLEYDASIDVMVGMRKHLNQVIKDKRKEAKQ